MDSHPLYSDFSTFMRRYFPFRVQKVSVDAGFTCPNRDGTKGVGGCAYCDNRTFSPAYCRSGASVARQLEEGKRFFAHKYPVMQYLAYFQAYSNTYADIRVLRRLYEEALAVEGVVGLVLATRPDCLTDTLLDYLADLARRTFLLVEFGIETVNEAALRHVNRGHTFADSARAIERTASRGILVGGHLIFGLPGDTRESILASAATLSALPLATLKIHQLQLIRGTRMAAEYRRHPEAFWLMDIGEYLSLLIDFIERLRPDIVLERFLSQAPAGMLIAPAWDTKIYAFNQRLRRLMADRGAYQGKKVAI
ncbi:MAG: TIGR01212 family radical SAM protein [Prevotellaceae bacterium]|nr:TIGR01212 family radical SAM protein [Prevotellaceae bacterium]